MHDAGFTRGSLDMIEFIDVRKKSFLLPRALGP